PTRTYGLTVRIPLWDGGARAARRAQSLSQVRQEEVRTADLRAEIELEVRLARDSLRSSGEQVQVAQEGLSLAANELEQARRRYQAGVSTGLEVTDAQARMERAQGNRISALFQYNVARIQLAIATGTVRETIQ
ncbi:MAG: TolC family protein, partial [Acidobacteriota bacterium]